MIHFKHAKNQIQWFYGYWVALLQEEEEEDEEHGQNVKSTFWDNTHALHNRSTNFCILVIFHKFFTLISLKVTSTSNWKWKWTKSLYMVFNGDRP